MDLLLEEMAMGDILEQMYDIITGKAGYEGRLKFAQKIGIAKNKASEIEDTPELLVKWKEAASTIIDQDIDSLLKK